jgi:hypothetical protein
VLFLDIYKIVYKNDGNEQFFSQLNFGYSLKWVIAEMTYLSKYKYFQASKIKEMSNLSTVNFWFFTPKNQMNLKHFKAMYLLVTQILFAQILLLKNEGQEFSNFST